MADGTSRNLEQQLHSYTTGEATGNTAAAVSADGLINAFKLTNFKHSIVDPHVGIPSWDLMMISKLKDGEGQYLGGLDDEFDMILGIL